MVFGRSGRNVERIVKRNHALFGKIPGQQRRNQNQYKTVESLHKFKCHLILHICGFITIYAPFGKKHHCRKNIKK